MIKRFFTIAIVLTAYSCNGISQDEYEKIKSENQSLKSELNKGYKIAAFISYRALFPRFSYDEYRIHTCIEIKNII